MAKTVYNDKSNNRGKGAKGKETAKKEITKTKEARVKAGAWKEKNRKAGGRQTAGSWAAKTAERDGKGAGRAPKKQELRHGKAQVYLKIALTSALCIMIFYPPYFRGLYFEAEQLAFEIFAFAAFAVFWAYKLAKKDRLFAATPVEYASLGFVLAYFLSLLAAIALRQAVAEWLKYWAYLAVFLMLSELAGTQRGRAAFLWAMAASGTGVALLGIDGAAGMKFASVLNKIFAAFGAKTDVIFDTFVGGRVHSTIQYPNSLAAYLTAIYFVCLGLAAASGRLWQKAAACGACFIALTTFALTISRGAYLLLPAAAAIFLIALPKGARISSCGYAAASVIPALPAVVKLSGYIGAPGGSAREIWPVVLAGFLAAALLGIAAHKVSSLLEKAGWKVYAGILAACALIGAAGVIYALSVTVPLELGNTGGERADKWSAERRSVTLKPGEYRLEYEVEAKMAEDKPYAYSIAIYSRDREGILFNKSKTLATASGKATDGTEKGETPFIVPDGSLVTDIYFRNYYAGTAAVFHGAKIVDAKTGETVKELKLKYKYLPNAIMSRLQDFLANKSLIQRQVYYGDGLKMIRDRWLLGAGGGAWPLLYFSYQSYLYWSTQPHNYPLQVGVEAGIAGLAALLFLIASIAAMFFAGGRTARPSEKTDTGGIPEESAGKSALPGEGGVNLKGGTNGIMGGIMQAALLTAAVSLILHSFIDFDLSLMAVHLLLWELLAVWNAPYRANAAASARLPSARSPGKGQCGVKYAGKALYMHPAAGIAIAGALMLIPALFAAAQGFGEKAVEAVREDKLNDAIKHMRIAASLDPLKPEFRIDWANLLIRRENLTRRDVDEAAGHIKRAEALCGPNVDLLAKIGAFYMSVGEVEKGLGYIDRTVVLRPFRPQEWQQKINAYAEAAMAHFRGNEPQKALEMIDRTLGIVGEAREANRRNLNPFIFTAETFGELERLKYIKDYFGKVAEIDISKVAFYNMPEIDVDNDGAPDQWSAAGQDFMKLEAKGGGASAMVAENASPDKWGYIQSRELSLKPGKNYRIEMRAESMAEKSEIKFYVTGLSDKAHKFTEGAASGAAPESAGEGKNEAAAYIGGFSTPDGFEGKNNRLRLYIRGKYGIGEIKLTEE